LIPKKFLVSLFSIILLVLGACAEDAQNNNNDDTISSMSTDSSSDKYPHTQPIRIQEAKYKFEIRQGQQGTNQSFGNTQQQPQQPKAKQQPQEKQQPQAQQQQEQQGQQQQQAQQPQQQQQQQATGLSQTEQRVVELTNAERRKQGLPDLKADTKLSQVAREKSKDMQAKGYFSHTSPTYGSPFDMMRDFGVTYQSAGENIAQGQRSPEEVVQAWMNSEGHRKNILSPDFTHIGVGHETTANHWTQMFIKK
jgi:uncharacterized YkwD family protein